MPVPRWYHRVGLVALALVILLLSAEVLVHGAGPAYFRGQDWVYGAVAVLGLLSVPLLALRRGWVVALVALSWRLQRVFAAG